jgi:hypothetical protein
MTICTCLHRQAPKQVGFPLTRHLDIHFFFFLLLIFRLLHWFQGAEAVSRDLDRISIVVVGWRLKGSGLCWRWYTHCWGPFNVYCELPVPVYSTLEAIFVISTEQIEFAGDWPFPATTAKSLHGYLLYGCVGCTRSPGFDILHEFGVGKLIQKRCKPW